MCIIAIKPKNKELQDKDVLHTCFTRNPDGSGYMFVHDGIVEIKKGYMNFDDFYKDLINDYNKYNLKNQNLVMHFRIGTSGQSKVGCTHPFAITNDYTKLNETHLKENIGVCHNGIISNYNDRNGKYSDTQIYIAKVLTPLIKLNINSYKFKDIQTIIKDTTNSKWAILDKFDDVYTIGDFVEDNGYLYSNSTYKKFEYKYTAYKGWYDDDFDDDEYYESWWKNYHKKPSTTSTSTKVPQIVTYKPLKKGNVVMCDKIPYQVITEENKYYFDKECNIYTTIDKKFTKVGNDAYIYTDETFSNRRDFTDRF